MAVRRDSIDGRMTVDTPAWVRDAVFYQIFPDRFAASPRVPKPGPLEPWSGPPTPFGFKGGDLLGIAEHLDDLVDLGITALYLTPIFQSASNHRYHAYDYLQVDPLLGGTPAFRELLDAAHARGIRVVLDGVFNHAGRGFWAFHHVLENGAASPYRDWFVFDQPGLDAGRPIRAYPTDDERLALERAGIEQGARRGAASLAQLGYQAWWDHPALPKWNVANPFAREYLLGVAEHWLRFGIDGWRLDVPQEIDDPEFWREFRRRVRAISPEAYIVGEIWQVAPEWVSAERFDALMNYPLLEAILGFTAASTLDMPVIARQAELGRNVGPLDARAFGARLRHLLAAYDRDVTAVQLNLLDSHDTPRFLTMAGGDRDALRLAVLLQMTLPGAPCVYYGDEVGLEGGHDPDSRRAFPWDRSAWDEDLRVFFQAAITLRAEHPVLRAEGTVRVVGGEGMTHVHVREGAAEIAVVAVNAGDARDRVAVPLPGFDGVRLTAAPLPGWADGPADVEVQGGRLLLDVPARQGLVLAGRR